MCAPQNNHQNNDHEPLKSEINQLAKTDVWVKDFDLDAFASDMKHLGDTLEKNQGPADVAHFNKMILWSNLCGFMGALTMGLGINPIAIIGLSTYTFTRSYMIGHTTCHGGYDKVHPNKSRWNRFRFAAGGLHKRLYDWFDWMMPEAWSVGHNNRHHYCLSEEKDPDLVEKNSDMRDIDVPTFVKWTAVPLLVSTFKWFYVAPNTYKELKMAKWRKVGKKIPEDVVESDSVSLRVVLSSTGTPFYSAWELFTVVMGPYFIIHFFLFPLPLLALGEYLGVGLTMYFSAVKNLFFADLLTNIHAFVAGATNHAGDDMYRFRYSCRPFSGSFYLRAVLASVDFNTGSDLNDFLHGYMNYQIEHHMWPSLSMLSYQRAQPLVKELCKKHGVPYVQQNVFKRVKKTVDIMTGDTSMRWFPQEYEQKFLERDAALLAAKKNKRGIQLLSDKCMEAAH